MKKSRVVERKEVITIEVSVDEIEEMIREKYKEHFNKQFLISWDVNVDMQTDSEEVLGVTLISETKETTED
jgi:hypothetical protein